MFFLLNPADPFSNLPALITTKDNSLPIQYAEHIGGNTTAEVSMVKANSTTLRPSLLKTKAVAVVIRPHAIFLDQNALVNLHKPYLKDSGYVMTYAPKNFELCK